MTIMMIHQLAQIRRRVFIASALLFGAMLGAAPIGLANDNDEGHGSGQSRTNVLWLKHFDLLPGDSSVVTTFNAVDSGVGGGLTALVVQSTTLGEDANGGGNKVVHM